MLIYNNMNQWRQVRKNLSDKKSIGFIPTMGNLHQGHASLFTTSVQENDYTVASLFINPTQFNQEQDFLHYPRTLDADLKLLENAQVDYCLLPDEQTIYADDFNYQLHENKLTQSMEGLHRPGHFTGMLTVVMKLINLVKPTRSYFGEKDYQQLQLIQGMVRAFFMDVEIIACPIIRETSGLACSSRNSRLNTQQRQIAYQFAKIFHQKNTCSEIIEALQTIGVDVDYIEEHDNRRFAAVTIGGVRLIDNYAILSPIT